MLVTGITLLTVITDPSAVTSISSPPCIVICWNVPALTVPALVSILVNASGAVLLMITEFGASSIKILVPDTNFLNCRSAPTFCLNSPVPVSPILEAVVKTLDTNSEKLALTFSNAVRRSSPQPSFT